MEWKEWESGIRIPRNRNREGMQECRNEECRGIHEHFQLQFQLSMKNNEIGSNFTAGGYILETSYKNDFTQQKTALRG